MRGWVRCLKGVVAGALLASLWGCPLDTSNPDMPQTRADAWRFLTQATFGPDEDSVVRVMTVGYSAWIDEQFALTPSFTYRAFMTQRNTDLLAAGSAKAGPPQVVEAFFTRAVTDKAQLRARMSFALSEIFVVSYLDDILAGPAPEMVAGHIDTLDANMDGNYRQLLEAVSKSPAMGQYLTFRGNGKEAPNIGRYPDENYAREIMQLFSIGLYELNPDGTVRLGGNGQPIETYTNADIKGLAKVFTGWSNYRGAAYASIPEGTCFAWALTCRDPEGYYRPMVAYPAYHSTSAKSFLGITIAPQQTASPQDSLTTALNRIASHPNVAPFFCRQLIQRFVTSNPSPAYVERVAQKFLATDGNLKATVKAILLDDEARSETSMLDPTYGKLREPLLRLTALLRAFKIDAPTFTQAASKRAYISVGNTSDISTSFGQAPYYAPSVFNFFRPGYTPPQSKAGAQKLVAPEMQLVNEASVVGYFNAVQDLLANGIGPTITGTQRNVTLQWDEQRAVANDVGTLIQVVADRLKGGTISTGLRQAIMDAVNTIQVPALNANQSNVAEINSALNRRVWTVVLMIAVSPEFLVTK